SRQVLADPRVQFCLHAIQSAEHGNGTALSTILASHMAGFQGNDSDRDRPLKVALAIHRQTRPAPVPGSKPLPDQLLDEMDQQELETFIQEKRWPERFKDRLQPSVFAGMDVRHHHGRLPPEQSSQDPVNNRAARPREPRASMEPLDPADVAPPRSAPPLAGAASCAHRDFIGAPAPVCGHDRVYDPTSTPSTTPAGPINAHLAADAELERQQIAEADEMLRALRRQ